MSETWVKVFDSKLQHQAYIVKEILEDNQIDAFIFDRQDSSYKFGSIEVRVRQTDVIKALFIVNGKIKFE